MELQISKPTFWCLTNALTIKHHFSNVLTEAVRVTMVQYNKSIHQFVHQFTQKVLTA